MESALDAIIAPAFAPSEDLLPKLMANLTVPAFTLTWHRQFEAADFALHTQHPNYAIEYNLDSLSNPPIVENGNSYILLAEVPDNAFVPPVLRSLELNLTIPEYNQPLEYNVYYWQPPHYQQDQMVETDKKLDLAYVSTWTNERGQVPQLTYPQPVSRLPNGVSLPFTFLPMEAGSKLVLKLGGEFPRFASTIRLYVTI